VSEELTRIDLVRGRFRLAEGSLSNYPDPRIHGHPTELKIIGEDPGINFLSPGAIHSLRLLSGQCVRVDSVITTGDVITGAFDSLVAKLIITGSNRQNALENARRTLQEFEITGLPTVIPFHNAVLEDLHFASNIGPWHGSIQESFDDLELFRTVVVDVEGLRLKVGVPAGIFAAGERARMGRAPQRKMSSQSSHASGSQRILAPMQLTVDKVNLSNDDKGLARDIVCVIGARKMEKPIRSSQDWAVAELKISVGYSLKSGQLVALIEVAI